MDSTSNMDDFQEHIGAGTTSTPLRRSLSPLHAALIEYATIAGRLLFIQDPTVFNEFLHTNETFNDYSTMELCEIMLKSVLPNVHLYPLTQTVKKRLKLLELHPCFRQTSQGYEYDPQRLGARFSLQPNCDFSVPALLPSLLSTQNRCLTRGGGGASHTLLLERDAVAQGMPKFQLSFDVAALISSFVSTDLELSGSELFDVTEIQRRLQSAKQRFEQTGDMSSYRPNFEQLSYNMVTFEKLKKKLLKCLTDL